MTGLNLIFLIISVIVSIILFFVLKNRTCDTVFDAITLNIVFMIFLIFLVIIPMYCNFNTSIMNNSKKTETTTYYSTIGTYEINENGMFVIENKNEAPGKFKLNTDTAYFVEDTEDYVEINYICQERTDHFARRKGKYYIVHTTDKIIPVNYNKKNVEVLWFW